MRRCRLETDRPSDHTGVPRTATTTRKPEPMRLTDEERAMLQGEAGPARSWALDHQMRVGRYLGAADFVPVSQAHIMADTESLGVAGVAWLERMAQLPAADRRVLVPTITD